MKIYVREMIMDRNYQNRKDCDTEKIDLRVPCKTISCQAAIGAEYWKKTHKLSRSQPDTNPDHQCSCDPVYCFESTFFLEHISKCPSTGCITNKAAEFNS